LNKLKNKKSTVVKTRTSTFTLVGCSTRWNPKVSIGLAGVAFDYYGMHIATAWPDGEVSYQSVPCYQANAPLFFEKLANYFEGINDIFVDDWVLQLQASQLRPLLNALLRFHHNFPVRVFQSAAAPAKTSFLTRPGMDRAVAAASFGFQGKQRNRLTFHKAECRIVLSGEVGDTHE
jgi:hypothetical protein